MMRAWEENAMLARLLGNQRTGRDPWSGIKLEVGDLIGDRKSEISNQATAASAAIG